MTVTKIKEATEQLNELTATAAASPEGLTPGNLDASVEALDKIVSIGGDLPTSPTPEEVDTVVDTVSNILSPNNMEAWKTLLGVSTDISPVYVNVATSEK